MKELVKQKYVQMILGVIVLITPFLNYLFNNLNTYRFLSIYGFCISSVLLLISVSPKRGNSSINRADILLFALIGIFLLSASYGASSVSILFYLKWLLFVGLFLIAKSLNSNQFRGIENFIILSGLLQAVFPFLQLLGVIHPLNPNFIATGLFLNPNYTAIYITISLVLVVGRIISNDRRGLNCLFCLILSGAILILRCRGALLAIVSSLIIFALYSDRFKRLSLNAKRFSLTFLSIVFVGVAFALYHFGSKSADSRILIWRASSEIVKENPWFGAGGESFKTKYMFAQAEYLANNPQSKYRVIADNNYQSYNEFVRVLCEQGLIGLFVMITLVVILFKQSKRVVDRALIVSIVVSSCFIYTFDILPYLFLLPLIISRTENETDKVLNNRYYRSATISLSVVLFLITIISHIGYSKSINSLRSGKMILERSMEYEIVCKDKDLARYYANVSKSVNSTDYNMRLFERIITKNISTSEMVCDFATMHYSVGNKELAEKYYRYSVDMIPGKIRAKEKLLDFYINTKQSQKAKDVAEEILNSEYKIVGSKVLSVKEKARNYIESSSPFVGGF